VLENQLCRDLRQHSSSLSHASKECSVEDRLATDLVELAKQFGKYGYRKIAVLIRGAVCLVSHGRIEWL